MIRCRESTLHDVMHNTPRIKAADLIEAFIVTNYARSFNDGGDHVVVVGLGDFGSVEGAGDQGFVGAEVVDEDFAVDLGSVERGAALPEEFGLFGFAFDQEVDFAAYPFGLG